MKDPSAAPLTGNDITVTQDKQGTIRLATVNSTDRSNGIDHVEAFTPANLDSSSLEFIDETHSLDRNHVTGDKEDSKNMEIEEAPRRPTFDFACYEVLLRMERVVTLTKDALNKLLEHSTNKDGKRDLKDEKALEWHIVAVAIDRLFFFIYLGMIIVLLLIATALIFPRKF